MLFLRMMLNGRRIWRIGRDSLVQQVRRVNRWNPRSLYLELNIAMAGIFMSSSQCGGSGKTRIMYSIVKGLANITACAGLC